MDPSVEMIMGSDIREIAAVSAWLEDTLGGSGFLPDEILDIQLAVEEVITNIIVHGYKKTGCAIRLSCHFIPGGIRIQVTDSAPRFDPLSIAEPEIGRGIDERKIGGLGIFLVRQVMDEISYRYEDGKNILTLEKRRAS